MKKWIWIIIAVLVVVGGVGYIKFQQVFPELTVKVMFDKVQEDDYALILNSDELTLTDQERDLLQSVLSTISYEIKGSRIEGQEAYVTVDLTFVDVLQLIINERLTILKQVLTNFFGTIDDIFNGRGQDMLVNTILSLMENEQIEKPMMSKAIDLPLKKQKGLWVPDLTEEWLNETFKIPTQEQILDKLKQGILGFVS
ncbi:hypothetical protein [Turicibacter sanguinis]|uniref:hypothetical protein n=1 Tax=Turicibacter sanguinis TaxID=154288 RepID=UPI00325AC0AF